MASFIAIHQAGLGETTLPQRWHSIKFALVLHRGRWPPARLASLAPGLTRLRFPIRGRSLRSSEASIPVGLRHLRPPRRGRAETRSRCRCSSRAPRRARAYERKMRVAAGDEAEAAAAGIFDRPALDELAVPLPPLRDPPDASRGPVRHPLLDEIEDPAGDFGQPGIDRDERVELVAVQDQELDLDDCRRRTRPGSRRRRCG